MLFSSLGIGQLRLAGAMHHTIQLVHPDRDKGQDAAYIFSNAKPMYSTRRRVSTSNKCT